MHLTRLALTDFRSYAAVDVPLRPGVTIFGGPNGEGKTNLVEAVGYAATLASHRAAQDAPLIRAGAEQAIIRVAVSTSANDALVETAARMIACSAPALISGASWAARWLARVAA